MQQAASPAKGKSYIDSSAAAEGRRLIVEQRADEAFKVSCCLIRSVRNARAYYLA